MDPINPLVVPRSSHQADMWPHIPLYLTTLKQVLVLEPVLVLVLVLVLVQACNLWLEHWWDFSSVKESR